MLAPRLVIVVPVHGEIQYRSANGAKLALARGLDLVGLNSLCGRLQRTAARTPVIRAVYCHEVLPALAAQFEEQVRHYRRHYAPVSYDDLLAFRSGSWPHDRPGLIIAFDDGWRCQAEVAAPILERHGFIGWFFLPVGFLETPDADFVREHPRGADLVPMSWDDARRLDRRHVVGCHTYTHRTLPQITPGDVLEREIVFAKQRLEERLGHAVRTFCWVRGQAESHYGASSLRLMRQAGFEVSFTSVSGLIRPSGSLLQLPRTNIEPRFPMWLVRFQLAPWLDLAHARRRRRIQSLANHAHLLA